jgi:hypothetical protein
MLKTKWNLDTGGGSSKRGNLKRVLIFCRSYLVEDFKESVRPLLGYEFRFITDGLCRGITDTRQRFYTALGSATAVPGFSAETEIDVIARCRLLRNLPHTQAVKMVRAMSTVLVEEMDIFRPDVVLSHMVDDYVTHLLAELSLLRNVVFVGYAYSYFPGKIQTTRYASGQPHDLREPGNEEVRETLEQISQRTFRQNYLQKDTYSGWRHLRAMLRYRVKRVIFSFRAWLEDDPLHMHYACLPYVVERRHWRDFPSPADFHADWRTRVRPAFRSASHHPILYFPLGYFPEATIDYWIEDREFLNYENAVLHICKFLSSHFHVLVKEHLHMLGGRSPIFYRKLRDMPGVTSVPPLEFSNDVLATSDILVIGAGSIGVEAFIRGKPIASFCDRSYWFSHAGATSLNLRELENWPEILRESIRTYRKPTEVEHLEFVRQCLRSTIRTRRAGKRWPICDPEDLDRALLAATEKAARPIARGAGLTRVQ